MNGKNEVTAARSSCSGLRWLAEMLAAGWSFGAPLGCMSEMAMRWQDDQVRRGRAGAQPRAWLL